MLPISYLSGIISQGPSLPTTATLSGASSIVVSGNHTSTVTLNKPADQTYTITWSRTGGGTGPATSTISPGQTSVSAVAVWSSASSVQIDFSISPSLTKSGAPLSVTITNGYADSDWLARSTGAAVIVAHPFDYDAEVTQHLLGSNDPKDHPVPVRRVVDDAGFGCLEQVVIGAELAQAYTAGDTTMVINDAYLWPDPSVTGSFYFMVSKAYPSAPDKNLFLCTAMTPNYPRGATLTVVYQGGQGSAFIGTPQSYSIGDYAGNENSREWRRTFAALPAGENGLPYDDPAASGAVPLRSKLTGNAYSVPRDLSYWQYGWYGHSSNQSTWANWTPWIGTTTYAPRGVSQGAEAKYRLWDGDTIYIQFRLKISRRFAMYHQQPGSQEQYWVRKTFALQSEVSSLNQLVVDVGPPNIWSIPETPQYPFRLGTHKDSRTVGADDYARAHASYQLGSPWDVAPYYADLSSSSNSHATGCSTPDGASAWKIPDEEWVTFHFKVKPGRSGISETEIKVEFARQDQAGYTGAYTTVLNVTDANIIYSGSGDIDFPDGLFDSNTVARMDALPGYQSFGLMGYLNLFQAAGWVPPRASYSIKMAQVIYSQAPIPAPSAVAKTSWLKNAVARTWINAPQTVTFASLDVTSNTSIVPSNADWKVSGLVGAFAWSGHTWDDINRKFSSGYFGGHNDYGGNDVMKCYIREVSDWQRVKLPSGCLPGPALTTNDGNWGDGTGRYSDGSLRASHTYHNHRFVPGYGHTIVRAQGLFPTAVGTDTRRVWTIDPDTGHEVERCDYRSIITGGTGEGSFDYDSKRNCLWAINSGTARWVRFTNLGARTWTATDMSTIAPGLPWDNYIPNSSAIRYVRSADRVACFPSFNNLGTGTIGIMDPNSLTFMTPTVTGSFSSGFVAPDDLVGGQQPGCCFEWCESLGCFLLWNNTSNTTEVSTLTPSNPSDWTQPWTRGVLSVSGTNSTNPGAANNSGVFGRATYSPSLNAVIVHPTYTAPISIFKL